MTRRASALLPLAVAFAATLAALRAAGAEEATQDSSLHHFLGNLADSTDRYFGLIVAPLDTAGLDSALAAGLEHPGRGPRTRARVSRGPVYAFNRVDGTLWGASAALSHRGVRWRVGGDVGYAAGSDRWLGGGELTVGTRRRDTSWRLRLAAGRRTEGLDRDRDEMRLATVKALVSGSDRNNYLRRDGFSLGATGEGLGWHAGLEYRDRLETPLPVTTRWNLTRRTLDAPVNLAATPGRLRELAWVGSLRLPGLPFHARLAQLIADRSLGSDFDFRRTRLTLGGELPAFGRISFVPQLAYGRLGGDPLPQAAFYLGGSHTLRSLPDEGLGGTGLAVGRLDVIGADDLLALARIPHPAMFPLQGGLFVAAGAVWGNDPRGGPGTPDAEWPRRNAWLGEAGASLLYHPGVPDEDAYLRLNVAWPLGADRRQRRWSFSYSRALDLSSPYY